MSSGDRRDSAGVPTDCETLGLLSTPQAGDGTERRATLVLVYGAQSQRRVIDRRGSALLPCPYLLPFEIGEPVKKRHGLLTVVLIVLAVFTVLGIVRNLALAGAQQTTFPDALVWTPIARAALGVVYLVGLWAIWRWKKWGFKLVLASALATWALYRTTGIGHLDGFASLVGFLILYGALQVGGDQRGWRQLD